MQVDPSLITAVVTGGLAVLGSYVGNVSITKKKNEADLIREAEREQHQKDQFDQINVELARMNKKLDEHNGYAKKFADTSVALTALQKDVEYLKEK